METVTYYMNAYSGGDVGWDYAEDSVDGSTSTFARANSDTSKGIQCSSNTCDGTFLGVINKVYYRAFCKTDSSLGGQFGVIIMPYFGGTSFGTPIAMSNTSTGWSQYYDITDDQYHPEWGINWNHIKDLDIIYSGFGWINIGVPYQPLLHYFDDRVYKIEIKVEYTPVVPAQVI